MKKLIIVRHAKSSWKHDVIDHERPLESRGFTDAKIVSDELKKVVLSVDFVISSDANRAKTTAELFISNLNIDRNLLKFNHDLYDFSGNKLLNTIKSTNNESECLMVFGHNYAITFLVNKLGDRYIDNVPTCGVVIIEFDIHDWSSLKPGKTIKTIFPRDLKK
ncbi:SixA phosphatase family protein [Confluentibacter flavum]|uniref:Histidine phosphatase family protein n=1 Tax=Confluentibacter flavum TaxID=1909700 RepID=A0A2N3HIF4_9FLAO|nr:histidine phosphatase family protein [Confluentibacter flavum]PKQ44598.1 histidine phosphatase family protein [Confluentibacter flavum]